MFDQVCYSYAENVLMLNKGINRIFHDISLTFSYYKISKVEQQDSINSFYLLFRVTLECRRQQYCCLTKSRVVYQSKT